MVILGFVGSEEKHWTSKQKAKACKFIRGLLLLYIQRHRFGIELAPPIVCSGRCKEGGLDIWAEEIADELGLEKKIYPAKGKGWKFYRKRNLKIIKSSSRIFDIEPEVLETYPKAEYDTTSRKWFRHSGGTWTVNEARKRGKPLRDAQIVVIPRK